MALNVVTTGVSGGDTVAPIWTPDPDRVADAAITRFAAAAGAWTGRSFGSYAELWAWSVEELDWFWAIVWDFFDIAADGNRDAASRVAVPLGLVVAVAAYGVAAAAAA